MPHLSDKLRIEGTDFDRRRKIDDYTKKCIREERERDGTSYNKLAKKYGCSKRSVYHICNPEAELRTKEQYKERRKDGRYYDRLKHNQSIKETRNHKQELSKEGKL